MKLKKYLKLNKITYREFAAQIGVSKQSVVWWVSTNQFKRRPNAANIKKIKKTTGGKVTANDFT